MSLKKQFAITLAAVGLGAALIGGGTFAAFNDIEKVDNTFASGTLDLNVDPSVVFKLNNLKPGDTFTRTFTLSNKGNLDISKVLFSTQFSDFVDGKAEGNPAYSNSDLEYLDQFNVDVIRTGVENGVPYSKKVFENISLKQLHQDYNLNGSTDNRKDISYDHIPAGSDKDKVLIKLTYKNNTDRNQDGTYVQNKFQGDGIKVAFNLEATQGAGEDRPNNN